MINFEVKRVGNISIFRLNEKRLNSSVSGMIKGEFTILLQTEDVSKFIVDMTDVESCDSSGLSALLLAYRILSSNQGHIRIANPSRNVKTLIHISQLDRVLPICDNIDDAINELESL
ncbi:MAG: STAS domain-containing protein [Ignavibacteria bacterium]